MICSVHSDGPSKSVVWYILCVIWGWSWGWGGTKQARHACVTCMHMINIYVMLCYVCLSLYCRPSCVLADFNQAPTAPRHSCGDLHPMPLTQRPCCWPCTTAYIMQTRCRDLFTLTLDLLSPSHRKRMGEEKQCDLRRDFTHKWSQSHKKKGKKEGKTHEVFIFVVCVQDSWQSFWWETWTPFYSVSD